MMRLFATAEHVAEFRQDAMTSAKVMLTLFAGLWLAGCSLVTSPKEPAPTLLSPYESRRVWAVAPLSNDSGSLQVDTLAIADRLAQQLENVGDIDVLPVNRVLQAMEAADIPAVESPGDARRLLRLLAIDGLVIGSVTAYDPYDPPKLGLALELFIEPRIKRIDGPIDTRRLTRKPTGDDVELNPGVNPNVGPINQVSAFFDAADPRVREAIQAYAVERGGVDGAESWHRYRISMDRYSEFVSYAMSWRLLRAEAMRLHEAAASASPPSP